jgi:hypothetical protein
MTETEKQKKIILLKKGACIAMYGLVLAIYGFFGATLLKGLFPDFSYPIFFVISVIACLKVDYFLRGPASIVEIQYSKYKSPVKK